MKYAALPTARLERDARDQDAVLLNKTPAQFKQKCAVRHAAQVMAFQTFRLVTFRARDGEGGKNKSRLVAPRPWGNWRQTLPEASCKIAHVFYVRKHSTPARACQVLLIKRILSNY